MSLFCLQMTTLVVYDYGSKDTSQASSIGNNSVRINENQLLRLAESTPNVQNLHINIPVVNITPTDADRLGQLWPRVQELDLEGSEFESEVLGNFTRHFPLVTKLKMDVPDNTKVQVFDAIFSNKPNLVDLECNIGNGMAINWLRSCHVRLERFAMNRLWDAETTLDTLEDCCKNSLQTIKVGLGYDFNSPRINRIFSTFHELRNVSFSISKYTALENQPILPRLEKLCLQLYYPSDTNILVQFLNSYPQLKELHLEKENARDELVEKIATTLPNLRSLSFFSAHLTSAGLMKLTSLQSLEFFHPGLMKRLPVEDVLAFVRQMPSLQRLTFWMLNDNSNSLQSYYSLLFKSIRDDIRSSASDRRLLVGRDDLLYLSLDSRDKCTDEAIEEFAEEMTKKRKTKLGRC